MTIRQIQAILEQAESLKTISVAYTEIASAKLKKIRGLVEKNRYFLENLASVYQVVKQVANKKNILPVRNNKTISIVITSNYHFYGNVNTNLIAYFVEAMKARPTDQIIIGKTAFEWLKSSRYNKSYTPILLSRDYPTLEELSKLVSLIKDYSQVLVFYSQLKSVMVQVPTFKDITQTVDINQVEAKDTKEIKHEFFIFEPELVKITDFFENQVTNLLLQGTFLESELSRTASRLISMDQAQSNADKYIYEQKVALGQVKKSVSNSRLLEIASVLSLLKKEEV